MGLVLESKGLTKRFDDLLVLDGIDLDIEEGERLVILGPSGCGKTTFLRIVAGLAEPDSGKVKRGFKQLGYVFQSPTLIPWKSVLENLKYVLEDEERAKKILKLVDLDGFENNYPRELSWGMRQRVNLARALMVEPDFVILDEPFSSLDIPVKFRLMDDILRFWNERSFTLLMVTHDIDEALKMGDRIVVFSRRPARVLDVFSNVGDKGKMEEKLLRSLERAVGFKERIVD